MTEHLYYADSFLTEFDAAVTEIHELSRENGQSLWRIALDRSAFYPTSGGQPHDTGELRAAARSGAELIANVIDVEEDEQGNIWHHTAKPLSPGTEVHGVVHRDRRLDHMQQHSGQHLLSAAFLEICNAPTVSFHLGDTTSTIDLAIGTIPPDDLQQVEELANRVIGEDRRVSTEAVTKAQAEAWFASGELRKLPSRDGDIRIIEIAGENVAGARPFDRNACGGTHVRSTGQIGGLHLRGMEKVRQGWRIEFVCGLRAMRSARADFRNLTDAGRLLSVGLPEIPAAIQRLQTEGKQTAKQVQAQTLELARYQAAELIRETAVTGDIRRINLRLTPATAANAAYAKLLASQVTSQSERTIAVIAYVPQSTGEPASIVLARSADLALDCGTILRQALNGAGGKGGGSKELAQGSVAQEHLESAVEALRASA